MAVLGATSLTGCNSIPDFIGTGSLMIFRQTAAPTSWTKDTTSHNNKALRVVSGTATPGGTQSFTTVLASRTFPTASASGSTSHSIQLGGSLGPISAPGTFSVSSDSTTAPGTAPSPGSSGPTSSGGSVSATLGQSTNFATVAQTTLSGSQIAVHRHQVYAGGGTISTQRISDNAAEPGLQALAQATNLFTGGGGAHGHTYTGQAHSHPATVPFFSQAHTHPLSLSYSAQTHVHLISGTYSGGAHTHTISTASSPGQTHTHPHATPGAVDFAVLYVDVILASKN